MPNPATMVSHFSTGVVLQKSHPCRPAAWITTPIRAVIDDKMVFPMEPIVMSAGLNTNIYGITNPTMASFAALKHVLTGSASAIPAPAYAQIETGGVTHAMMAK